MAILYSLGRERENPTSTLTLPDCESVVYLLDYCLYAFRHYKSHENSNTQHHKYALTHFLTVVKLDISSAQGTYLITAEERARL